MGIEVIPSPIKIYHIVHVDRLPSIVANDCLWCDAVAVTRVSAGTSIGMNAIKQRRLSELNLNSYPDLHVGDCVPFYFCPRSVMLYVIHQANNPELAYRGGQGLILHFESDLNKVVAWAEAQSVRWAFTLSNAGSSFFEDRNDLASLSEIDWDAIQASDWRMHKEGKQAEFLLEQRFPWHLIERIGVNNHEIYQQVVNALPTNKHRPNVEIRTDWYY
jgi:ssDNA thymidine ADP-ribosyltransferase, DarT